MFKSLLRKSVLKRFSIIFALSIFGCSLNGALGHPVKAEAATASQVGMADLLELYSQGIIQNPVDPTGIIDSTDGFQEAINWCKKNEKTLFIPGGTYIITKTIECIVAKAGGHLGVGRINIIGSTYNRPVIKIPDNCSDYWDTDGSAIFKFFCEDGWGPEWLYRSGIRNLIIDLGNGNTGAVGIDFDGAQDCYIEDVTILARDGFAGITHVPGRSSTSTNIEIIGGRYGINIGKGSLGACLVGIRLQDQTEGAIKFGAGIYRGISIVGLEITGCNGAAIETAGSSAEAGSISVTDAKIAMVSGPAIKNPKDRSINLRDVYVTGTQTIIDNGTGSDLSADSSLWTRVERYNYVPEAMEGVYSYNIVNGIKSTDSLSEVSNVASVPDDIVYRNVWSYTPSFEDADVIILTPRGLGLDDRENIQNAIDTGNKVFLAAGTYEISDSIVLHEYTVLMGVPGLRTCLKPTWQPSEYDWCIETDSSASGNAYLLDIGLLVPDEEYIGGIHWRIGRNSIVRRIRSGFYASHLEKNKRNCQISGDGGGRWYGIADHIGVFKENTIAHPDYRKVYITGTSQPLSLYGFNLERGGAATRDFPQVAFLEAVNASNIRTFGNKAESRGNIMRFTGCNNIFVSTIITNKNPVQGSAVKIENSTNIELHNIYWPGSTDILIDYDEAGDNVSRDQYLGYFCQGSFDNSVFSFEYELTPSPSLTPSLTPSPSPTPLTTPMPTQAPVLTPTPRSRFILTTQPEQLFFDDFENGDLDGWACNFWQVFS